jgi:predicted AAA+ superfamily ATPase
MRNRNNKKVLHERAAGAFGRILVLTGARQTGKTTLVKEAFPDYEYISLEDPVLRMEYKNLSAQRWADQYPLAVLDEIQKTPQLVESIKAVYDQFDAPRYLLLGSSQILLMKQVRESLAGRCQLLELYPLTLPEMLTQSWDDPVQDSRLIRWVRDGVELSELPAVLSRDVRFAKACSCFDRYLQVGGYPVLWKDRFSEEEAHRWLYDYVQTYLQRDIRDLAEIRNLEPFVLAQQMSARLTGELVNYSALAKETGITAKTAQRFLQYLQMSYQVVLLQPWFRNSRKRLVKSPKLHYLDPGVQSAVSGRYGALTGHEFESAVVAEVIKQLKTAGLRVDFYHLRTVDGREVDLLLETPAGFYAIEVKQSRLVHASDARHLKGLPDLLDKPLLHAFLISNDPTVKPFGEGLTAIPAAALLS